ncbi:hypothetical protein K491DRAFT_617394 [Lophiostoma macrostomum CBS 122681]|uniref:Ribosomal RNA-processing protein 7 n=1 Tax=Lophiostoma macrostomum CBS 122681 TaxID=1314788 RepID=A0A6A6TUJ8_9PLEO|nr:hypothetical protein K491DRAFT_617394 [Lophiostoma macrostomum CBS 122681]
MPPSKPKSKSKSPNSTPTSVNNFAILPLTLPAQPTVHLPDTLAPPKHYLYIKPHEPSAPTPTADRSLFISNVPFDATADSLRELFFEQLGDALVEHVEFDSAVPGTPAVKRWRNGVAGSGSGAKSSGTGTGPATSKLGKKRKRDEGIVAEGVVEDDESRLPGIWPGELRKSGSTAVVVFVDRASCKGAWKAVRERVKSGAEVRWEGGGGVEGLVGLERYKQHNALKYPSKPILQASINAYLSQFTRAESARNRVRKYQRSIPDEDGFVTVTRGGRTGPARLEDAEKKKVELEERRKSKGVKDDFYRFQTREKKKEAEGELRRKFELDKKRVEEMRMRRGKVRPET